MTTVGTTTTSSSTTQAAILEFLVHQLLHTPLVGGEGLDESTREAAAAHDQTRTLCLRLVRRALLQLECCLPADVLPVLQDDLCLSLLMTGQAIWAGDMSSQLPAGVGNGGVGTPGGGADLHMSHHVSPGFVSLEVLSEICATLQVLWNAVPLRQHLIAQFETILTGFYTRALVLLRKRLQPVNSVSYTANMLFDAEVEIILESLVDILCLHNHNHSIADGGDGGSLETMFSYYDCHMRRSDVATQLFVELSRCCGGTVNTEGEAVVLTPTSSFSGRGGSGDSSALGDNGGGDDDSPNMVRVEHPWRPVPAHLKELCAQALMGGMACLFRDDHASAATMLERSQRKRSIMLKQMEDGGLVPLEDPGDADDDDEDLGGDSRRPHQLRDLKSKKRLLSKAARIFNKKASRGIEFLIDSGLVADPMTPESMARFLRNGIVVGLDKQAVGAYLGEAGKAPMAGKSPPVWERDWFHKDVLKIYCSLFRFEGQTLVDGLRMFLATFRLPGEAQQIDRILQAFSDRCSQVCEEASNGRLKVFSADPKRASDAAYLLSFSIIMLNTDRHNANIREDRKMSCADFIKNNTDYGRDITEKGKEFPREYLTSIYDSINEEEIRTEGEGADGAMTVERWKDVLRGSTEVSEEDESFVPSVHDAEDLTELVLEHVWKPIVSAIAALWGVSAFSSRAPYVETPVVSSKHSSAEVVAQGNMLGVQGARLGMDMSFEMLHGVCQLGRVDIFRRIFRCICDYSGLLDEYTQDAVERTWAFANSLESQAALVVAVRTALEFGEDLDEECWKRVWSMVFELRDLKLISAGKEKGLFRESDPDILNETARIDWNMCLMKGDMDYVSRTAQRQGKEKSSGLLSAFGRALFGAMDDGDYEDYTEEVAENDPVEPTAHGKEALVVWNESAPSDDEEDADENPAIPTDTSNDPAGFTTPGTDFEDLLVWENMALNSEEYMPVTGLERVEETRQHQVSPRCRVRERLRRTCDLASLVSESRFMDESAVQSLMRSLVSLVSLVCSPTPYFLDVSPPPKKKFERSYSDISTSTDSLTGAMNWHVPISPASEAFAEVLICELALKNKDRLKYLWSEILQDHYLSRLTSMLVNPGEGAAATKIPVDPGLEKRVTGLLRLTICAVHRQDMANEILAAWKYLLPVNNEQHKTSPLRALDRHIGEGLWRIVAQVDNLATLNDDGWEGLMSILNWCAERGGALKPISAHSPSGLAEDDPALQCFRSLHLLLHNKDLADKIPCAIVGSLRSLIVAGGRRNYAQLSIASLDMLDILRERKLEAVAKGSTLTESFWPGCWRKIVEGIAEAAEQSVDSVRTLCFLFRHCCGVLRTAVFAYLFYCFSATFQNVRQHALSMLTGLFLQRQGESIPSEQLCAVLSEVCVPLAGRRILRLQMRDPSIETTDQLMMEFELCIGLIFKPLRHHCKSLVESGGSLPSIWQSVLLVLEELLSAKEPTSSSPDEPEELIPDNLKATMDSLANEHLQSAIQGLLSTGVLSADSKSPGDLTSITWASVSRMGVSDGEVQEWKQRATKMEAATDHGEPVQEPEAATPDPASVEVVESE